MGRYSLEIRKYYIVELTLKQCKAYNGSILTKDNEIAYCSFTNEGGGWNTINTRKESAKRFEEPPTKEIVANWDGMPWYCNIKSHKVIEVVEESYFKRTENVLHSR